MGETKILRRLLHVEVHDAEDFIVARDYLNKLHLDQFDENYCFVLCYASSSDHSLSTFYTYKTVDYKTVKEMKESS